MLELINKESNSVEKSIKVLEFQQEQQLKNNWKIANEPLKIVTEEYDRLQLVK